QASPRCSPTRAQAHVCPQTMPTPPPRQFSHCSLPRSGNARARLRPLPPTGSPTRGTSLRSASCSSAHGASILTLLAARPRDDLPFQASAHPPVAGGDAVTPATKALRIGIFGPHLGATEGWVTSQGEELRSLLADAG